MYFYHPGPQASAHSPGDDPHEVEIADVWDRVDACNIDQERFALRPCPIAIDDFGNDRAVRSGPLRVHQVLPDEADALSLGRVAFFNLWKPLRRVEERPLAMCDAQSTRPDDMLRMDLRYSDRTGEIYAMRYSPAHPWYYFPRMEATQALLPKCHDSQTDGRARCMPHSPFEDPTSAPDAPPRESIEPRTMAFF